MIFRAFIRSVVSSSARLRRSSIIPDWPTPVSLFLCVYMYMCSVFHGAREHKLNLVQIQRQSQKAWAESLLCSGLWYCKFCLVGWLFCFFLSLAMCCLPILDGRNRAIVTAASLARVVSAIQIASAPSAVSTPKTLPSLRCNSDRANGVRWCSTFSDSMWNWACKS